MLDLHTQPNGPRSQKGRSGAISLLAQRMVVFRKFMSVMIAIYSSVVFKQPCSIQMEHLAEYNLEHDEHLACTFEVATIISDLIKLESEGQPITASGKLLWRLRSRSPKDNKFRIGTLTSEWKRVTTEKGSPTSTSEGI